MAKTAILSVRITSSADNDGFRKATREIGLFQKRMKAMGARMDAAGGKFGNFARGAVRAVAPLARMAAIASGATVALGGVAAPLAAIGSAAAATLAPIGALTAALAPAALGAGALSIAVLRSAVSGFDKALQASNPDEFAAAIADLGPAAQAGARGLYDLKTSLSDVAAATQESFWSNLTNLGDLAVLVAPLRSAMTGLAADMGTAASGLVQFVSQGTGLSAMQTLISVSAQAGASLASAFADATRGIIAVGAAAAPIFADLSAKIAEVASAWGDRMVAGFQDGSLPAYFANAVAMVGQLRSVLGELGGIVSGVFSAMSAAGAPFLGTIGQMISATNEWVNSAQGMSTLTSLFSAMTAAVAAILPIVGQLAGIIGGTLAPVVAQVITTVAPALSQVVAVLGQIVAAIAPILPIAAQFSALFSTVLTGALTALLPLITQFSAVLQTGLQAAFTALAPVVPVIVAAFQQLAAGLQPLIPAFASLVAAVVGLIPPIVSLASAVIPPLVSIILALVPVIQAVIGAVAGFLAGLQPLIAAVASFAGPILGALASILGTVASALAPVIGFVVRLALEFGVAIGVVTKIRGALSAAARAFDVVRSAISGVVSTVRSLIGALSAIRWPSPPAWLGRMFGEDASIGFTGTPATPGGMLQAAPGAGGFLGSGGLSIPVPSTTVVNINVEGALDPRAVAEQIRGILRDDARTRGLALAGTGARAWQ